MTDLLDFVVEAHGGLKRWDELETVSAHLIQGGVTWEMVGQKGALDDVFVTASLHEERVSHYPFGAAGRSVFTPERVVIDDDDGTVVEALDQPRASFAGHTVQTPWTAPQLAYFVGTAMWTYLTQPFTFTLPGFDTSELEPWQENGELDASWTRTCVALVLAAAAPVRRRACIPDPAPSHRHARPPAAASAGHFHPMPAAARRPAAAGYPLACQPSRYPLGQAGMTTVTNKACADGSKLPADSALVRPLKPMNLGDDQICQFCRGLLRGVP